MRLRGEFEEYIVRIGESLGSDLYEFQRQDTSSPEIQREKQYYTEQIGKASKVCFMIYLLPIIVHFLRYLMQLLRHPDMPDTLYYELIYTIPEISYGMYAIGAILIGSYSLSSDLFDNFLISDMHKGRLLGLVHSGAIYLFIGSSFQAGATYEPDISRPELVTPGAEIAWAMIDNFGVIFPYVLLVIVFLSIRKVGEWSANNRDYEQLRLDSPQWNADMTAISQSTESADIDVGNLHYVISNCAIGAFISAVIGVPYLGALFVLVLPVATYLDIQKIKSTPIDWTPRKWLYVIGSIFYFIGPPIYLYRRWKKIG